MTTPDPATTIGALRQDGAARLAAAGIDDAALEAEVLLRHALGLGADRARFVAMLADAANAAIAERFAALVARRVAREPTAYIIGGREFYGLGFACAPVALIPRPETEMLVDEALAWLRRLPAVRPLVVDVGTGTGALAVAIAANAAAARVLAIDVSAGALALARGNARRHGVAARCGFARGDLLTPLRAHADVIVANLPYVREGDVPALAPEIREHEPRGALVAGPRGTEVIEGLIAQAPAALARRSLLLCECGDGQGEQLRAAAQGALPGARIEVRRDLAGLDRMLRIECGATG